MHKNTRCILEKPLGEENPTTFHYLRVSIQSYHSYPWHASSKHLEGEGLAQVSKRTNEHNITKDQQCMNQRHALLSQETHKDIDPKDLTINE